MTFLGGFTLFEAGTGLLAVFLDFSKVIIDSLYDLVIAYQHNELTLYQSAVS
jgi:hypothetical protein